MRKVVLYFNMTLDAVVSDVEKWSNITDELFTDSIERYGRNGTVIFGGNSYQSMAEYWLQAEISSENPLEKQLARLLNDKPKLIISRSDKDITWRNASQLKITDATSLAQKIKELKNTEGNDITVEAGIKTWQLFIEQDIFDEVEVMVHPVIYGDGRKLFTGNEPKINLELVNASVMGHGISKLHYKRKTN